MRILLATFALAALLRAQTKPATGCPDLRSLTNNEITIAVATYVPESADAPAHCRVSGQILPQVGFALAMPAAWNGRFVMLGNGGFAGDSPDSRGRQAQFARVMRRGYAAAATDTGH